ncbi:hypothetical protein NE848_04490 [Gramella jeungdoensis]|uniref:Uncharacterized protein n=1 Tax=Gramella jeungdoensis TaxID=708091 RepID=A0ABT0YYT4_9FLAO|nr:hypothetical protein [Gramella jeungdoensis]MCM8568624.1 hypothetical protein [Gramella jeungdoensis]
MAISDLECELLIKEEKQFSDLINPLKLGPAPISWTREIKGVNSKNLYLLDFYRGSFELSRYTFNKRYKQSIIIFRYDNGGRHTNPDGKSFDGPHIHLYKEGYNDKFAYPIEDIGIDNSDSMEEVLNKILHFCNIKKIPSVEISMF